jgi:outer membrane protein insertion porin family
MTNRFGWGIQTRILKVGVSLPIRALLVPFNFAVLGKYGVPHTTFSSNYSLFYQKGSG